MTNILIEYLRERLKSNSTGPKDPNVPFQAARRFHRKYPHVDNANGADAVEQDCLSTCDQAYCQQKGWCYGGIVYINEKNVLTGNLRHAEYFDDRERVKRDKKMLKTWEKI